MGSCYSPGNNSLASMSAMALLQKAGQMGATTLSGYGVSFTHGHPGLVSTMAGLDRFPCIAGLFGPTRAYGPYDRVLGFDISGLMPGQLYNDGANDTTRNVGPVSAVWTTRWTSTGEPTTACAWWTTWASSTREQATVA